MTATAPMFVFEPLPTQITRLRSDGVPPLCEWCHRPIEGVKGVTLTIFNGTFYRHRLDERRIYALSHDPCGCPDYDTGYNIRLPSLLSDGLEGTSGWCSHLRRKNWVDCDILAAVEQGYELAQLLANRRPAIDKPFRPPRQSRPVPDARRIQPSTRAKIMERDGFRCRRCGAKPSVDCRLDVDHIVPVSKGGTGDETNLQTLCSRCNTGKGARPPHDHDLTPGPCDAA